MLGSGSNSSMNATGVRIACPTLSHLLAAGETAGNARGMGVCLSCLTCLR